MILVLKKWLKMLFNYFVSLQCTNKRVTKLSNLILIRFITIERGFHIILYSKTQFGVQSTPE